MDRLRHGSQMTVGTVDSDAAHRNHLRVPSRNWRRCAPRRKGSAHPRHQRAAPIILAGFAGPGRRAGIDRL